VRRLARADPHGFGSFSCQAKLGAASAPIEALRRKEYHRDFPGGGEELMDDLIFPTAGETRAVNDVMRAVRVLNEAIETAAKLGIRFEIATENHPISLSRVTSDYATVSATLQHRHA
jgi:hypothetical protein